MSALSVTLGHAFKGQEIVLEVLRIRSSLPILEAVIYTRVKGLAGFIYWLDGRAFQYSVATVQC